MAKARPIPGLSSEMSFAEAAALTVRVRAQELVDHSAGVLDTTSIQHVHAMRVASRRLRAVLEIHRACFPPELFKPVLREVKDLADALGARRDPDVQLESIAEFARALGEEEQAGIELFASRLRDEQEAGNAVLEAALVRMTENDLPARLQALADSAVAAAEPEPEPEPEPTPQSAPVLERVEAPEAPERPEPVTPAAAPSGAGVVVAPAALVRAPTRTGLLRVLRRAR